QGRARSVHVEDRRGPDLLLPPARHLDRRRREHDRQRFLQGSVPRAADGICRRGSKAPLYQSGRISRLAMSLEIKDLRVIAEGKEILKGLTLTVGAGEVHAIMGPNGSGKSTLARALSGHPGYEVTGGSVTWDGQDLL